MLAEDVECASALFLETVVEPVCTELEWVVGLCSLHVPLQISDEFVERGHGEREATRCGAPGLDLDKRTRSGKVSQMTTM